MSVRLANPTQKIVETLDSAYAAGHLIGRSGKKTDVFPTGMSRESGHVLTEHIRREGAAWTIETGFALGLSTLFMLEGTVGDRSGAAIHTAVDPFEFTDWDGAGANLLDRAGVTPLVRLILEDSAIALPALVAEGERFDLAFVDGGHLFDNVFLDIHYMIRLVRPGGLILVDDLWMPAIRAAVAFFVSNCGLQDESKTESKAERRFAVLRTPTTPPRRKWDHFVPFSA